MFYDKDTIVHAVSKSEQVRRRLLASIKNGEFENGTPIPSDNVLSELFGISRNTVREAVSSLVADGLLVRLQGKGTFLRCGVFNENQHGAWRVATLIGWEPRGAGKEDTFFNTILRGAHQQLASKGWGVALRMMRKGDSFAANFQSVGGAAALRDGVIFGSYPVAEEDVELLEREGIPAVCIGRPSTDAAIDYVDVDHATGVSAAVKYLFELGHRRIAFIDSPSYLPAFEDRQSGFRQAHKECGIEVDCDLMVSYPIKDADLEMRAVDALSLESRRFTALIVYGEFATFGAITAMREKGLHIPQDVSVLSLHPNSWVMTALGLELTRVTQSTEELGRRASELLIDRTGQRSGGRSIILPLSFTIGTSCATLSDCMGRGGDA